MKNIRLFICILLIFIIISFQGGCSNQNSHNNAKAMSGTLDLTQSQLDEEIIRLDGQWEFYWNQLLEPGEMESVDIKKTDYINVPSSWNAYIIDNKQLFGGGYATYRLFLKIDENERLGIKVPRVFTSYNLWANGELIATAGKVDKSRGTMVPQYVPQVALFESHKGENEIVIQVSNFYHRSGGILESLIIGSENKIIESNHKRIAYEIFLFSSLTVMGIYHIALFFFRKRNTPPLYFGVFSLLVGIRTLLVGERLFNYIFPNFNWEAAHKIQSLTFYIGVPLIIMFFKSVFPNDFHSKFVKIVLGIGIAFGVLVIITPVRIFTVFNPLYQILLLFIIIYIISRLIRIFLRNEEDNKLIGIGALILILTSLNDIVFLNIWVNDYGSSFSRSLFRSGSFSSFGQLIFVFTNSLVLAKKFSTALENEEVMTKQLREINFNLDELVVKRTKELENANRELQVLSLKDSLTGLWNRRQYDDTILMACNCGFTNKTPVSLMVLDIDHFKAYNDYYGHKAGDECLVKVSQAIQDTFKCPSDLAARYGGEEFAVIMPNLGKVEAIKKANLARKAIEDLKIPHESSPINTYVTMSIGVTSAIPEVECYQKELFLIADKALYEAKNTGRNKVKFLP